jgi:glycosyltransferase involved in cell wall biosynthesis
VKAKRILFITHEATLTGAPKILREVIGYLDATYKIEAYIVVREQADQRIVNEFAKFGQVILAREAQPSDYPEKIDLIYSNTCTNGSFLDSLPYRGVPVVTHVHELTETMLYYGRQNMQAVLRQTWLFIACSGSVANHLVGNFGVPLERIRMVPSFLDTIPADEKIAEQKEVPELAQEVAEGTLIVGGAGWASFRKGTDLFLQLLKLCPDVINGRKVKFLWLGGNMEHYSGRLPVEVSRRLLVPGPQANPFSYFRYLDVFALTSREDPFPLVMLEVGYMGKPIIGFSGSGGVDELAELRAATTVPALNLRRFLGQIALHLSDEGFRRRMGEAARRVVKERFTGQINLPLVAECIDLADKITAPTEASGYGPLDVWRFSSTGRFEERTTGMAGFYYGPSEATCSRVEFDRLGTASLRFVIESDSAVQFFRFDPDSTPGLFIIRELRMHDESDHLIYRGVGQNWPGCRVAGTARRGNWPGYDGLIVISTGVDPQVILDVPLELRKFTVHVEMESCAWASSSAALLMNEFMKGSEPN